LPRGRATFPAGNDAGLRSATLACLLVAASIGAVLAATARWGPVVTWDSLVYLQFAAERESSGVMALFSPLFPLALSGLGKLGLPVLESARLLNATLLGAAAALAILFVRTAAPGVWTPLVAGALVATSRVLLEQFVRVMSDPLALVLGFLGLLWLYRALDRPERLPLVLAGVAVGLALAARYASLPYLLTGAIMIASSRNATGRRRLGDALLFSGIAATPLVLWLLYNVRSTGRAMNRELVIHVPPPKTVLAALHEVSTWILPPRVPAPVRFTVLAGALLAIAGLVRMDRRSTTPILQSPAARLLLRFLVVYAAFLLFVMTFVDASVSVGTRHWVPAYFAVLLLSALLLDRVLKSSSGGWSARFLRLGLVGFLAVSAGIAGARGYQLARNGAGYSGRRVQTSVLRLLLDPSRRPRPIYTDDPEGLSFIAGAPARRFPSKFHPQTARKNDRYAGELERAIADIRNHRGMTVRFFESANLVRYPSPEELEETAALRLLARDEVAAIYESP